MAKVVRTWNASEQVSQIITDTAPKGRGFSKWVNEQIEKAHLNEKNGIETPRSEGKITGVKL